MKTLTRGALRRAAFLAAAIVLIAPLTQAAPKVVTLASMLAEKGYTMVPMKRRRNMAVVPVTVNGRVFDLAIDTGAFNTILHSDLVFGLGLDLKAVTGNSYGAFDRSKRARQSAQTREFKVGNFVGQPPLIEVTGMGPMDTPAKRIEGVLGLEFLHDHAAIINCFDLQLFLHRGSVPESGLASGLKAGGYVEIPVRFSRGHLFVPAALGSRTGYMLIDTGLPNTIVDEKAAQGLNYPRFGTRLWFGDIGGNGAHVIRVKVSDLRIGAFNVPGQEVGLADLELMRSHAKAAGAEPFLGLLGQDLLTYYVAVIDCGRLRLFLHLDPGVEAARKSRQS